MNATLSEKGQVTIPKPLREALGLHAGSRLDFREEAGRLVVTKVLAQSPLDKWRGRGSLPAGAANVDAYLGKIRDAG
ncbi:MAG: AbrB/MazE/SpoVT family DNA-binding domain-containing protein [Chthoniobacterales bacterium]|nr:AbrB/MazE/SpoVT family DNA-binding domain-containing protein [Chthoniobacterales bacterium]